jgi:transposase
MDGMGKQRRPRTAFTPEFRAEIVEVCRRGAIGQVTTDFDLMSAVVGDSLIPRPAEIARHDVRAGRIGAQRLPTFHAFSRTNLGRIWAR